MKLSHVDEAGRARMVDVGDKPVTVRTAVAEGAIRMSREAFRLVADQQVAKGDALAVSQVAGTLAAKRTAELIPLCHPLGLDHVEVDATLDEGLPGVRVRATAKAVGRTGVEMEALTAVSVALLPVYDMVKGADRAMEIEKVRLLEKTGGTRGDWRRDSADGRRIDGAVPVWDRLDLQERAMHTTTQKLMLQGGLILLGALVVSSIGGWARRATADDQPAPLTAPALVGELRSLEQALEATRGELAVARLQLERANAIIDYSTHYAIAADLAAAIYDVALAEGVDPALAFRLVKVESGFNSKAKSKVGALGYTQVLPSTARLYEPGLTTEQLYDRGTNLRLGFRYLRDLLERYEGNADAKLRLALLAYNRGPGRVQELLDAGKDPQNGYAAALMKGYRRKS